MADELEIACRLAYGAYVHLQGHAAALAGRSATARLLAGPAGDAAAFALARAREELEELRGVLAGTHGDPLVLEASQVGYWCTVAALAAGLTYDDWSPHRAWRGGGPRRSGWVPLRTQREGGDAQAPECRRILAAAGAAIAGRLAPLEAVRYDLAQLRGKDYLADYFAAADRQAGS